MGAATVSYRVNAERIVLVAWLRALLLQIAHPLIAAGVREHSSFRASTAASVTRLQQTINAMLAITFGTGSERARSLDAIRAIHRRVHGRLSEPCGVFPAGTPYSAEHSDLLVWVHATLVESIVLVYQRLIEPLTPAERDRYCADSADVAVELGAHPGDLPRTWPALRAYLRDRYTSGSIAVCGDARALASVLLSPLRVPLARRVVTAFLSLLAAGLLPPIVRRQYGIAWNRRRARRFTAVMQLLRIVRRLSPARVALWNCARSAACREVNHGYSDNDASGYESLNAEHEALKAQTAALRREHNRLHTLGGTKAERKEHIKKLREKIKELEEHVVKLKNLRTPDR